MPRFAANLTTMFTELEPKDRFIAARQAGFDAVEYLMPYGHRIDELKELLESAQLEMILLNTSVGDSEKGECGLAALPGREQDFRGLFDQALEYASALDVEMIHVLAGVVPDGVTPAACDAVFTKNLQSIAGDAAASGVTLLIEPLNTRDVPGYLHTDSDHARRIIDAVDRDNVRMQFDFYHLQIMEGDLHEGLKRHLDVIGHVQFSSVPNRHEPQYGEVNLPFLFERLDEMGYKGWVGCEYQPKTTTIEGLVWALPYGIEPE